MSKHERIKDHKYETSTIFKTLSVICETEENNVAQFVSFSIKYGGTKM